MNTPISQDKLLKSTRLAMLISGLAFGTLFAIVLAPLYLKSINDVGFGFDFLPDILDALMLICHLASFFIAYAIIAYSFFRFPTKKIGAALLIFVGTTVYKYILNLLAGWLLFDGIPTKTSEINLALLSVFSNIGLELIQHAIVIIICCVIIRNALPAYFLKEKQMKKMGDEKFDLRDCVFPFTSIYSSKNPLQRSAFYAALTISVLQIAQLLIHDIFIGGLPSSLPDALWMIAYYVGSIILGALCYLFMVLVMTQIDSHELKLREKYDI